jgi:hypothetical protein
MNGRALAVAALATLLTAPLIAVEPANVIAEDGFAGLSLRISDEEAPAGSIVQIKIDVTEPKPISTGRGKVKVKGITGVEGIALMNHGQDTYGVALVDGDELTFFIQSPSSLFGTPGDYPIVAIAGTVANASIGTTFPLTMEPGALRFEGPNGAEYPLEIKNGQLTVANGISIGDVTPGSTVVPAGGVVHISGTNFTPDTRLQLSETSIAQTRFINSHQIDVVLGQTTDMHGLRIRARNDKSESTYFSYERTSAIGASADSVLSRTVPLFAPSMYTNATIDLPKVATRKRRAVGHSLAATKGSATQGFATQGSGSTTLGFALQNLNDSAASASVELLNASGFVYATNTIAIGPGQYLVRAIPEVFGTVVSPSSIRIRSSVSLQVLGVLADHSTGTATALPPH